MIEIHPAVGSYLIVVGWIALLAIADVVGRWFWRRWHARRSS
jgi:hypothetical protein